MPIISVSGKTRRGKTSWVLASLLSELIGEDNERYVNCVEYLEELKRKGVEVTLPPQEHTISANIDFVNHFPDKKAYEVNGFDLGVPNDFHETLRLMPYGTYILDEAQRYYMQDETKHLPPWVLMMFQISGQYYIKFILISQRYIWIHKDIRALVDLFVYILECKHKYKIGKKIITTDKLLKHGKLLSTTWWYKEFDDEAEIELYLKASRKDKKNYGKSCKYTFKGDITQHYDRNNFQGIIENTSKDFRYFGASIWDFTKPDTWKNYKDVKDKEKKNGKKIA